MVDHPDEWTGLLDLPEVVLDEVEELFVAVLVAMLEESGQLHFELVLEVHGLSGFLRLAVLLASVAGIGEYTGLAGYGHSPAVGLVICVGHGLLLFSPLVLLLDLLVGIE